MDKQYKNNEGSLDIYISGSEESFDYTLYAWAYVPKYFLESFILDNPIGNKIFYKEANNETTQQDDSVVDNLKKAGLLPFDLGIIIAKEDIISFLKTGIMFSNENHAYFDNLTIKSIAVTPKKQSKTHKVMYIVDFRNIKEHTKMFSFKELNHKEHIIKELYSVTTPDILGGTNVEISAQVKHNIMKVFKKFNNTDLSLLNPLSYVHPEKIIETPYYAFINKRDLKNINKKLKKIFNKSLKKINSSSKYTYCQYIYDNKNNMVIEKLNEISSSGFFQKRVDKEYPFKTLLEQEAVEEYNIEYNNFDDLFLKILK